MAHDLALVAVQLHGNEDSAYARELRHGIPEGCELWKAVPGRAPLNDAGSFEADGLLLDSVP